MSEFLRIQLLTVVGWSPDRPTASTAGLQNRGISACLNWAGFGETFGHASGRVRRPDHNRVRFWQPVKTGLSQPAAAKDSVDQPDAQQA